MNNKENETPDVKKVLVGCTGSVASIKIPLLIQDLQRFNKVYT